MLEYNLEDAEQLLDKNLNAAHKSLNQVEEDLGFLRDQTTTIEVSILICGSKNGLVINICHTRLLEWLIDESFRMLFFASKAIKH